MRGGVNGPFICSLKCSLFTRHQDSAAPWKAASDSGGIWKVKIAVGCRGRGGGGRWKVAGCFDGDASLTGSCLHHLYFHLRPVSHVFISSPPVYLRRPSAGHFCCQTHFHFRPATDGDGSRVPRLRTSESTAPSLSLISPLKRSKKKKNPNPDTLIGLPLPH